MKSINLAKLKKPGPKVRNEEPPREPDTQAARDHRRQEENNTRQEQNNTRQEQK